MNNFVPLPHSRVAVTFVRHARPPHTARVRLLSRTDGPAFGRRLHAMLRPGLFLYRDLTDLAGGEDWWRQVEAAIRSVEHVVLLLSEARCARPTSRGNGSSRASRAPSARTVASPHNSRWDPSSKRLTRITLPKAASHAR
jgi:hypothetical protein